MIDLSARPSWTKDGALRLEGQAFVPPGAAWCGRTDPGGWLLPSGSRMWTVLRTLLRLGTLVLLLAAAYLVVFHPSATVAGVDLGSPTSVSAKCSSLFDQWDHHARPAELEVDGNPTVPLT